MWKRGDLNIFKAPELGKHGCFPPMIWDRSVNPFYGLKKCASFGVPRPVGSSRLDYLQMGHHPKMDQVNRETDEKQRISGYFWYFMDIGLPSFETSPFAHGGSISSVEGDHEMEHPHLIPVDSLKYGGFHDHGCSPMIWGYPHGLEPPYTQIILGKSHHLPQKIH